MAIPFDALGQMEVDFLCVDARLSVEIDGAQHLGDARAYRSDRRKDILLQEVTNLWGPSVGDHRSPPSGTTVIGQRI